MIHFWFKILGFFSSTLNHDITCLLSACSSKPPWVNFSESGEISSICYIWFRMKLKIKNKSTSRPSSSSSLQHIFLKNAHVAPIDWYASDRLQMFWERHPNYKERRQFPRVQLNLLSSAVEQMWSSLKLMENALPLSPTKANKTLLRIHELLALKEMHSRKQKWPECVASSVTEIHLDHRRVMCCYS